LRRCLFAAASFLVTTGDLGISGCRPTSPEETAPVADQPVYINLSVVQSFHPAWQEKSRWSALHRKLQEQTDALPVGSSAPADDLVQPLVRTETKAAPIDPSAFIEQVMKAHARQTEYRDGLRHDLQAIIDRRVRSRREALESSQEERLAEKRAQLDREFLEKAASIPGRYAHRVAQIDLKLTAKNTSTVRRQELTQERSTLQDEWRRELSKLLEDKDAKLRESQRAFQELIEREIGEIAKALSDEAFRIVKRQNQTMESDLQRGAERPNFSAVEQSLPPVPVTELPRSQSPSPAEIRATRRRRQSQVETDYSGDLTGLAEYVKDDTLHLVCAIAREHRWEVRLRTTPGVPDRTSRALKEIRRKYWNTTAYRNNMRDPDRTNH